MNRPSIKDKEPDRKNLSPTGPAQMPPEAKEFYDDKHPNAGNVETPQVGPSPTDDPKDKSGKFKNVIDKKRGQTPPN